MSTNSLPGTGGASIVPRARPSIRSHPGPCLLAMGKHGLHTSPLMEQHMPSRGEGRDVVDNVMSKPARDPVKSKYVNYETKAYERRNSFNSPHCGNESSIENTRHILATSLPPRLPSYSRFSDDSEHWPEYNTSSNSLESNTSEVSGYTPNNSDRVNNIRRTPRRNTDRIRSETSQIPESATQEPGAVGKFTTILGILFIAVVAYFYIDLTTGIPKADEPSYYYNQEEFSHDLNDLGVKYKISDNSILQLKTGILTISQRADAGSFIFAYNSNANNFDAAEFSNFIKAVSSAAAKYLRNESTSFRPTVIDGSKLEAEMQTHGELISRFRHDVDRSGVMLVKHIEEVPSSLAMAFHYYCDEYNPVAKKSAILFTLDLAKCNELTDNLPLTHLRVEKCLASKWKALPSENMGPLLTRVVDIVVDVTRGVLRD